MSNGPGQAGLTWAWLGRHEGHQSKPSTVQYHAGPGRLAGWLTRSRSSTVILTRVVSDRRHDGPVGLEPIKNSKIQNLNVIFKFIFDSINYIYNFRYILRQRISDTHINTDHNLGCSHIITESSVL
jgi:hypothetical protein